MSTTADVRQQVLEILVRYREDSFTAPGIHARCGFNVTPDQVATELAALVIEHTVSQSGPADAPRYQLAGVQAATGDAPLRVSSTKAAEKREAMLKALDDGQTYPKADLYRAAGLHPPAESQGPTLQWLLQFGFVESVGRGNGMHYRQTALAKDPVKRAQVADVPARHSAEVAARRNALLRQLQIGGETKQNELFEKAGLSGVSRSSRSWILCGLVDAGLVMKIGRGSTARYRHHGQSAELSLGEEVA